MESGHALIDEALKVCKSRYRLSKLTGIPQSNLSLFYSGARPLTPVAAAKIASIAGLDPKLAAAVAIIESEQNPVEREVLKQVFFQTSGVVMLLIFIIAGLIAPSNAMAHTAPHPAAALTTTTNHGGLYIM